MVRRVVEGNQDPVKVVEEGDVVLDETPSSDGGKNGKGIKVKGNLSQSRGSEVPVGDGGFVVCASGPERLTREAANAVGNCMLCKLSLAISFAFCFCPCM